MGFIPTILNTCTSINTETHATTSPLMKILIIQQKMIGDVLTSTVLLEALKSKFPNAALHYLIEPHTVPVIENNPFIDKTVVLPKDVLKSYLKFYGFLKNIKNARYDVVIDVYGKISSKLITRFSGAKTRVAYTKKGNSFFYNHSIDRLKSPIHHSSLALENRLRLLEPLAISFENWQPKIYVTQKELQSAHEELKKHGIHSEKPLYMIAVLGSSEDKTYPPEYMAELLDSIVAKQPNAQLLFNYIPKQLPQAKVIYDLTSGTTQQQIFLDIYGKSLREFMALTPLCNALIGNEGGAVNMAKALNIPTFIIFSPYLNKKNWFAEQKESNHVAVHLADFVTLTSEDIASAKESPKLYYLKLKPSLFSGQLINFINQFQK